MENRLLIETKVDATRLLRYCQSAFQDDGDLLAADEREELLKALNQLEYALNTPDREQLNREIERLKTASASFAQKRMNRAIQKKLVGTHV